MNPNPYQDDARHEALSLSPAEKADGFAAVMKRLKGRSEQERTQLRARADAAILGHEAYALGHDNLRRGNHVAAKRWLRVAADHSVPGAEQALEEIETGSADDLARPITVMVPEDLDPCPAGSSHAGTYKTEKWPPILQWEAALAVDAARAEAQQITAQARRTAVELIAKAREDIDRAWADAREKMAAQHRVAAELLHEAERLQQDARLLERNALRTTESVADAQPFAEVLRDEPQERARTFAVDFRCQTDELQSEPQQSLPVKASRAVRTAAASIDVDAGRLLKLRLSGCSDAFEAGPWLARMNEFVEGYPPARHSLPESFAEAYEATWQRLPSAAMPRTDLLRLCSAVFRLGSMRQVTAVRPLNDIDLVVWLGPERRNTDEATPNASLRNIARGTSAGNEVALPTSNAEDRPDEACLKIIWVTGGEVDENGAASGIVSFEKTAHATPR